MSTVARNAGSMPTPGRAGRSGTFGERLGAVFACADRAHAGWLSLGAGPLGGGEVPGLRGDAYTGEKAS